MTAALECQLLLFAIQQEKLGGWDPESEQVELFHAAGKAISDGSYDEAAVNVFLRHQLLALEAADSQNPDDIVRWQKTVNDSAWPEWVKLTLEGAGEVELAWLKRSTGWAGDVKPDQWRGFAEHLKIGRDVLAKANRLRPDRPEAATKMITVCLGESVDIAELRGWFDRAVSAQFDYMPAYQAVLWAYRPRWLGNHEMMLAFGRACAETKRFDTAVPSRLMVACADVTDEVKQAVEVFRHELVKEPLVAISRGYLDATDTPPLTRAMRVSNAAMCAWLADDDALADEALKKVGPHLDRITVQYLSMMLMHEKMLRAEVAADVGSYGEAIRKAANPPPKTGLKEMGEMLAQVDEKGLSPEAMDYLLEAREMVGFQAALDKGGWVKVTPRRHLTNFHQTGGDWSVEDGALVITGSDDRWAKFFMRVPTKDDLEMRGEISFDVPKDLELAVNGFGFGPLLRWLPDGVGTSEGGVRFMLFTNKDRSSNTVAYGLNTREGTPERRIKLQDVNTFSVRMADGMISYDINGQSFASRVPLKKMEVDNEIGFIGFASFGMPWGGKVRVKNIEVRKISGKDLVSKSVKNSAAVMPLVGEAEVMNPGSNPWLWQGGLLAALVIIALLVTRFVKPKEE